MNKKVLIVDNDPDYLDSIADFIETTGYEVYRAVSLDRARQILDYIWIHIAIIDIRMQDDTDAKDTSGLLLAKDPVYRAIPKIMLTRYPTYEAVREALGASLEGLPPAVAFISKHEDLETMLQVLNQTFSQHVRVNQELTIAWSQPFSFPHLVNLIQSESDSVRLLDRAAELEDLFRKLFHEHRQITIGRVLNHGAGRIVQEVFAYPVKGRECQFIVSCGQKEQIVAESARYADYVPHGTAGSTVRSAAADTLRFAATAYILSGGDLEEIIPFREFYQHRPVETVIAALERLYNETLATWYRKGRTHEEGRSLATFYLERLGLSPAVLAPTALERRVTAMSKQMLATGLIGQIETKPHRLTLRFSGGEVLVYPNPIVDRYEERIDPDTPILYGMIHGKVDADSVLVDRTGQSWLLDFTQVGHGPLMHDFVVLETAIKLELLETLDLQARHTLEHRLLEATSLSDTLSGEGLPDESQRALKAIQHIRQLAATLADDQVKAYQIGLFFCALKRVAVYDPSLRYMRRQLMPHAHSLMLAAMLYERLIGATAPPAYAPKQAHVGLWIDETNQTAWVVGRQVELTEQEFTILACLYQRAGQLCTRKEIADHALGSQYDVTEESRLNSALSRLRLKIEPDPNRPRYLVTVRGRGYRLVPIPTV